MTDINRATIDVEVRIRFEENGHRRDDLLQPMICHMKRTWILYCFKYWLGCVIRPQEGLFKMSFFVNILLILSHRCIQFYHLSTFIRSFFCNVILDSLYKKYMSEPLDIYSFVTKSICRMLPKPEVYPYGKVQLLCNSVITSIFCTAARCDNTYKMPTKKR
ncbi:hypothetical protein QTP88_024345 [Uroleucon formosanum]